ncbi:diacylglycerol kinase family protein [Promethearchaeum syntrophicum]|uniref:Diacylglycerol kinase family protein n=1 Tax=Promethearchaeum syntrophicum TaxID=2594042 RepID=A0A5B9DEX6_9ARCH|nr:diacylglycerol kinase family protein [Candidatus Prometheoarchaeum syntrophicum]QEE17340.1 putative lipid kinase [Candidatus Prometheoarchaeum syntrophicum]
MTKDYAIIYNPVAAAGKLKDQFNFALKTLDKLNVSYQIFKTEHFQHAIDLSLDAAKDGLDVIGVGGDGTCNEVLNGVIKSNTNILLGFIPIGSGMDIPGAIGIRPDSIKRACEIIAERKTGKSDIGLSINAHNDQRYFLGIGSQGFDAEVTKRTNESLKSRKGTQNYVLTVLKTVFKFKKRKIRVTLDKETWEGMANLVAVGNGPTYGGWMYMCPKANVHDGMFHISIIDIASLPLLINFNSMYSRNFQPHKKVFEFVSKNVKIEMLNNEDVPYIGQIDGEIIGNLPITYKALREGYEFIQPMENEAEQWFQEKHGKKFAKYVNKLRKKGSSYYDDFMYLPKNLKI